MPHGESSQVLSSIVKDCQTLSNNGQKLPDRLLYVKQL